MTTPAAGNPDPSKPGGNPDPAAAPKVPAWRGTLPEDIRGEKLFDNFKGEEWTEVGPVLAKSLFEGQKLVGKRVEGMVKLPGKDAKPEDIAVYRKALGVPDTAAGYTLEQPFVPDGMHDSNMQTAFTMEAHKLGMTQEQVQGILNWNASNVVGTEQSLRAGQKAAKESLETDWGAAYPVNISLAQKATHWLGGEELFKLVDGSPWGSHPTVLKALVKLGKELASDGLIEGRVEGIPTKDEAQRKIGEIMGDQKSAYFDRNHPGHEQAVKDVYALRELIAG